MKFYWHIILLSFVLFFVAHIHAQAENVGFASQCLKDGGFILLEDGYREFTGSKLPTNKDIYIVNITMARGGVIVTTGNDALDAELKGYGINKPQDFPLHFLKGGGKMQTDTGNILIRVDGSVIRTFERAMHVKAGFYAVYKFDKQAPPEERAPDSGGVGGLQIGELGFEAINNGPDSTETSCLTFSWDPAGRIFDANTLEPMDNVEITIFDAATKQKVNQLGVANVTRTDELGYYQFFVQEGDYYLEVTPPDGFSMINSVEQVHPNYSKAYGILYKKNDTIVERIDTEAERAKPTPAPDVEMRDVPLFSSTQKTNRPFVVYSHIELANGGTTTYSGQASHPLQKIYLKQNDLVLFETKGNINGGYAFDFDSSLAAVTSPIDLVQEKTDLTLEPLSWIDRLSRFITRMVFADQKSVVIRTQPILSKVEGVAYDKNNKPMPYAIIHLRIAHNNEIAITVNADKEGYFSVPQNLIPRFAFYFEYVDPVTNNVIKKETSDFAEKNKLSGNYDTKKAIANIKKLNKNIPLRKLTNIVEATPQITTTNDQDASRIQILLIITTILVLGGIGMFAFIKNKQQKTTF